MQIFSPERKKRRFGTGSIRMGKGSDGQKPFFTDPDRLLWELHGMLTKEKLLCIIKAYPALKERKLSSADYK